MRNTLLLFVAAALMVSCHESLEKRAQREAREYTEKNCPTPWYNYTRTDSVVFNTATRTYTYYCSVNDKMDNATLIADHEKDITNGLRTELTQNTGLKTYKEAGYNFAYVMRSDKNKQQVLYKHTFTAAELGATTK